MNDDVAAAPVTPVPEVVTHFYGLFSATQGNINTSHTLHYHHYHRHHFTVQSYAGLPVSHVILGTTDAAIEHQKQILLSIGRLAATVSSTAPR